MKTRNGTTEVDEAMLTTVTALVGLKDYVTNIEAALMPATEVIASYHDLWHVGSHSGCPRPTWPPGPSSPALAMRSRPA